MMARRLERRHEALISRRRFATRMFLFFLLAIAIEAATIGVGAVGFHYFEKRSWLDAALNAAMVITGNGPSFEPADHASKIFQLVFSLFGVVTFVLTISVVLAPLFHRVLHVFHAGSGDE